MEKNELIKDNDLNYLKLPSCCSSLRLKGVIWMSPSKLSVSSSWPSELVRR